MDGFSNTSKFQPLIEVLPKPWIRECLVAYTSAKMLLASVISFPETPSQYYPEINGHLFVCSSAFLLSCRLQMTSSLI